jgi:hypothetical protein
VNDEIVSAFRLVVRALVETDSGVCPPKGARQEQAMRIVVKYIDSRTADASVAYRIGRRSASRWLALQALEWRPEKVAMTYRANLRLWRE